MVTSPGICCKRYRLNSSLQTSGVIQDEVSEVEVGRIWRAVMKSGTQTVEAESALQMSHPSEHCIHPHVGFPSQAAGRAPGLLSGGLICRISFKLRSQAPCSNPNQPASAFTGEARAHTAKREAGSLIHHPDHAARYNVQGTSATPRNAPTSLTPRRLLAER